MEGNYSHQARGKGNAFAGGHAACNLLSFLYLEVKTTLLVLCFIWLFDVNDYINEVGVVVIKVWGNQSLNQ